MKNKTTKNLHLQHPEDSILTGDLTCLDWFTAPNSFISTKLDGSPAVVFGINPATGNFFVGTKSVFNKVKIKINESHQDIDANHEGNVAEILHLCFDYLPRTKSIIQGDWIGAGGSDEYKPNTITYKFPDVVTEEIILAPHTVYIAENDLRDAVAYPMKFSITDTPYCKFVKPDAYIVHQQESFADVKEVCAFARQMSTMCEFASNKEAAKITKKLNDFIRAGEQITVENVNDFDCDPNLIRLWCLIRSIKEDCLFLCRDNGPAAYLNGERIMGEGYVMTNEFGMYKLVNREEFSMMNFVLAKSW